MMKQGIETAVADIVAKLEVRCRSRSRPRTTWQTLAAIAANNDREHWRRCSLDAMEKVGKDGVITVDEGKSSTRPRQSNGSRACSSTAVICRLTS